MKVLALSQNFDCQRQNKQKENINFSSLWVKAEDAVRKKQAFSKAVDLTDESTYKKYLPLLGLQIIGSLQQMREVICRGFSLQSVTHSDQLPHLFLHGHENKAFFDALDAAVIEIGASPLPEGTRIIDIIDANMQRGGSRCSNLKKLIMDYVLKADTQHLT